jgi:peptide/nickel transport system permease protein
LPATLCAGSYQNGDRVDVALLITKRAGSAVFLILALVVILFVLQHLSSIDPAHAVLGANASAAAVKVERHKLGLDRPILVQFIQYLDHLAHGNLGSSYRTGRPVLQDLGQFLPATIELTLYALLATLVLGGLFGVGTALRWRGSWIFRMLMMIGSSTPSFLTAVLGLVWFYKDLGWLPATGRTSISSAPSGPTGLLTLDCLLHGDFGDLVNAWWHLLLPVFCIALVPAVSIGRVLRSSLVSTLDSDYIRTAQSKGLRDRKVVWRHALRNSLGPTIAMLGLQLGLMFSGIAVIEDITSWPGIGFYTAQSITVDDFPAIAGVTLAIGVGYVAINLMVDLFQMLADPRQRPN